MVQRKYFNVDTGPDFTIRRKIFGSDELTNDMNTYVWDTVYNSLSDDQEYSIGTTRKIECQSRHVSHMSISLVLHHLAINGHRDVIDQNAQDKLQKSKKWMIYVQDREVRVIATLTF